MTRTILLGNFSMLGLCNSYKDFKLIFPFKTINELFSCVSTNIVRKCFRNIKMNVITQLNNCLIIKTAPFPMPTEDSRLVSAKTYFSALFHYTVPCTAFSSQSCSLADLHRLWCNHEKNPMQAIQMNQWFSELGAGPLSWESFGILPKITYSPALHQT